LSARRGPPCALCGSAAELRFPATTNALDVASAEFACTNVHAGDHGAVYWCGSCQLGFSLPPDSGHLLSLYESVSDPSYLVEIENRQRHAESILRTLEHWHAPGSLLEIGSQVGVLLHAAEQRGWQALGIEPSKWAVETGRRRFGVDLVHGSLEAADFEPGSFDCIVMVDVLEHLIDPLAALKQCHAWLANGGILALSTVNMDTIVARLLGTRWPGFMDMHLTYFTTKSLREFLRRSDFEWVADRPDSRSFSLGYFSGRLVNNGRLLRTVGTIGTLPLIRKVRVTLPTRDLLLVVARPA
jgi:2-polyprenyl-3-methyl-5-hydroxy-6-metoxy-1,4-benzoquinol methylase